jgi:hypothetical protein
MTVSKQLIDELEGHFSRYLQEDRPAKCHNLMRMCITFDGLKAQFNKRYKAVVEAQRETDEIITNLKQTLTK